MDEILKFAAGGLIAAAIMIKFCPRLVSDAWAGTLFICRTILGR
jgi:hypothetical protein